MDTNKWKSVLVPIDTYKALKKVSQLENRAIGGQLTFIFEKYCKEEGYEIRKLEKVEQKKTKIIEID